MKTMPFTIFSPRLNGGLTVCFEMQSAPRKFFGARFCKNNAVQSSCGVNSGFRGMMIGRD